MANLSFLRHTKLDGFIVTMHQSGTHWLKHMLACAITRDLGLPPPQHNFAGDVISSAKKPKLYTGLPSLGHSHTIPSPIMGSRILHNICHFPRHVVLVRDLRAMLLSQYEKRKQEYDCEFSEFLKGDITGRRFRTDIWWSIRFQNAWGSIISKYPDEFMVIKYENMVADTLAQLQAINTFLRLNVSIESLIYGIQESTKEKMSMKPNKPPWKKQTNVVIKKDTKPWKTAFSKEDEFFFKKTCNKYLKYDFEYDYS